MTRKQTYLRALMNQSAKWVLSSARQPNQWMTPMHIKLHYLALRKMGAL